MRAEDGGGEVVRRAMGAIGTCALNTNMERLGRVDTVVTTSCAWSTVVLSVGLDAGASS